MRVVNVEVSGVVPAPVDTVWSLLTAFTDTVDYKFTRSDVETVLHQQMRSRSHGRRAVMFSNFNRFVGCLYEELIRADNRKHALQYKLTSDPRNVNPFPASFLDVLTTIKLYDCTLDNTTFVRISSVFKTEIEMSGVMSATWERIHRQMLLSLIDCLSDLRKEQVSDASFPTIAAPGPLRASASSVSEASTSSVSQLPNVKPEPLAAPHGEAATKAAPSYQYFLADQPRGMAASNRFLMPKAKSSPSCDTRIKPEYPQVGEAPEPWDEAQVSTPSECDRDRQRSFFRSSTGSFDRTPASMVTSMSPAHTVATENRASLEEPHLQSADVGVNAWLRTSNPYMEVALPEAQGGVGALSPPAFRMDHCWAGRAFDIITSHK